jgi:hypothetical protein
MTDTQFVRPQAMPQAWLTEDQWGELSKHLSRDLDDYRKARILDFIDLYLTLNKLNEVFPKKTPAALRDELKVFQETARTLMPQVEVSALEERGIHLNTVLSLKAHEKMASAYISLSSNAKAYLNDALWLMTRTDTAKHIYHPSQYEIAATLAIQKIPKPKKGGGNPLSGSDYGLYLNTFRLWRDLGHNTKGKEASVSYRKGFTEYDFIASDFVDFTYKIFQHSGIIYSKKTICEQLKKYKIVFNKIAKPTAARLTGE